LELPAHIAFEFAQESQASWDDQRVIEAADTLPFEQYRQEYLSPDHLVPRKKKAA
jgi:glutamate--cysteine ligase